MTRLTKISTAILAYLLLSGCVQSERYSDYSYSSSVTYGDGHTITQHDHGQWRESSYTPPQADIYYQNGNTGFYMNTPQSAPPPAVYHAYPIYPQTIPEAPYIRSEQTILPTCTQQRTIRRGGQTIVVQQLCR